MINETLALYDYAMRLVGTPYRWGGDDPMAGFDCSGLACELLMAAGKLPHGTDMTAQMLFNKYHRGGMGICLSPSFGSLSFYGKDPANVTHVGICLNSTHMIEAGGGGSKTTSLDKAIDSNAYVRVRPIRYRSDFLACMITSS